MPSETTPEDAGAMDVEVPFVLVSMLSVSQSVGQYIIWTFDEASQHVPEQVKFPVFCCKLVGYSFASKQIRRVGRASGGATTNSATKTRHHTSIVMSDDMISGSKCRRYEKIEKVNRENR